MRMTKKVYNGHNFFLEDGKHMLTFCACFDVLQAVSTERTLPQSKLLNALFLVLLTAFSLICVES